MPVFTFYLNKGDDLVPSFEIALFDSTDPAIAHGRRLLQERPQCLSVEITCNDAEVARLTQEPVQAP